MITSGVAFCRDFQAEVEARAEADKRQAGMPASAAAASSRAPRKIKGAVFGSEEQAAEEPERSLQVHPLPPPQSRVDTRRGPFGQPPGIMPHLELLG